MKHKEFRAWNKKEKRWATKFEIAIALLGKALAVHGDIYSEEDFEINEWTGYHDNRGVKVYEGDLIKIDEKYGPYAVIFDEGQYGSCAYSDFEPLSKYNSIEVVSNVFVTAEYEGIQYESE